MYLILILYKSNVVFYLSLIIAFLFHAFFKAWINLQVSNMRLFILFCIWLYIGNQAERIFNNLMPTHFDT